jgi:hypothetical protein
LQCKWKGEPDFKTQPGMALTVALSSVDCSCTIRNVPRIPEHCIVYALKVEWPLLTSFTSVDDFVLSERSSGDAVAAAAAAANPAGGPAGDDDMDSEGSVKLDKDNVQHMTWLYNRAQARAARFGISGVTYNLTMQVVRLRGEGETTSTV